MPIPPSERLVRLKHELSRSGSLSPYKILQKLVTMGLDNVPYPGHGQTLERWQSLAAVAAQDLSLAKFYEGHTDALAILAEIGTRYPGPVGIWGVWCAEPPDAKVTMSNLDEKIVILNGRKAWCSGAGSVTHALISTWNISGEACLVAVKLNQPGVDVTEKGWHAVGMADSQSVDVNLTNAIGVQIGAPGAYLRRPGFWHGGAGIAACWYGAACSLARRLHSQLHRAVHQQSSATDPIRLSQLGEIDMALQSAAAILRNAAAEIDRAPSENSMELVLRTRLVVEAAATHVLALATRALGAGPLCREPAFAKLAADLPVFLRQSHAERDMATLGAAIADCGAPAWAL